MSSIHRLIKYVVVHDETMTKVAFASESYVWMYVLHVRTCIESVIHSFTLNNSASHFYFLECNTGPNTNYTNLASREYVAAVIFPTRCYEWCVDVGLQWNDEYSSLKIRVKL